MTSGAMPRRRLKYAVEGCFNGIWGEEPNGADEDVVVVRVADFDKEHGQVLLGDFPTVRAVPESYLARRLLNTGDLLIEKSGGGEQAPVGNVVMFNDDIRAVCSNFVARMPVVPQCEPRFVRYVFQALYAAGRNLPHVKQTSGIQNLDSESYLNELAWLPEKGEQERIANFLDEKAARIDALIAEKERLSEQLVDSLSSQTLALIDGRNYHAKARLAPGDRTAQLPPGWSFPQLARLTRKLTNGYVGPTRDILVPSGVRYLQSLHIKNGAIDFSRGEYFVEQEWSEAHAKSILREGDILIVQTGDIGQTAVVTDEFVGCNCHALIIAAPQTELVDPQYLELVLRSPYGRACFYLYSTGALHPHLNCSNIRDIRVPLPPLPVQHDIVRAASNCEKQHTALLGHAREHAGRLKEYRSSLISAAVTGQLDFNTYKVST